MADFFRLPFWKIPDAYRYSAYSLRQFLHIRRLFAIVRQRFLVTNYLILERAQWGIPYLLKNTDMPTRCSCVEKVCYITVDSAMAASQNGFCFYKITKLTIRKKTNIIHTMTKNIKIFINIICYHREL
jgi:hypothetical protein